MTDQRTETAIAAHGLTKRFGAATAVERLELTVRRGELFALLGVNGAGKSTTVKMLSGLVQPTDGDAEIMGHSIRHEAAQVRQLIGVSPQETAVAPNLDVRENLALMCGMYGMDAAESRQRIEKMIAQMGLAACEQKKAGKLSGGWQRRLSIAMALIPQPQLLFLDEPTLGLDVLARSDLWDVIRGLKGSVTILLTTHYMEEAEALADRIGIMKAGRMAALGTAAELMAQTGTDKLEAAFVKLVREAEG